MDNQRLIEVKELMALCGAGSPQGFLQWLKRNLVKINTDGVHAEKVGKSWLFDSIAVERIMELRGASNDIGVVSTISSKENALQGDIERLTQNLTMAQGIVAQKQDTIIKLQAELMGNVKLITEAKSTEAQAVANASILQAKVDMLEARVLELTEERDKLLAILSSSGAKKKKKKRK